MKRIKLSIIAILGLGVLLSATAYSSEVNLCAEEAIKPVYLKDVGRKAAEARQAICATNSQLDKNLVYANFIDSIRGWFDNYGGFEGGRLLVDSIKRQVTFNQPSIVVDFNLNDDLQVGVDTFKPADQNRCVRQSGAPDCETVLAEFIQLHNQVQKLQAGSLRLDTLKTLRELRAEWDLFIDQMKGQTWLELWVNRKAYANQSNSFARPPSRQWIILHPTVLVEYVDSAADGENFEQALGLELVGMNWWQQDKWYVPSGASLIAVYADRAESRDVGYGVALHFLNDYSIGYTNHDGDEGIFLSVDLIKLFQDKKQAFDSYKSMFD